LRFWDQTPGIFFLSEIHTSQNRPPQHTITLVSALGAFLR
jgi:hypothetical protein